MFGSNFIKRGLLSLTQSGLKRPTTSKTMIRAMVERAVEQSLVLKIKYVDEKGEVYRTFRFDRIKSAAWTGDVFDPADERIIEQGKKERGTANTATA